MSILPLQVLGIILYNLRTMYICTYQNLALKELDLALKELDLALKELHPTLKELDLALAVDLEYTYIHI